jgi:glucose/arabinose dehydrogenase
VSVLRRTAALIAAASLASTGAGAASAAASASPPPPRAYGHTTVTPFASGLKNPTSFAFGDGAIFAGDSGNSRTLPNGGVFVLRGGTASAIPHSPIFVGGMQFHRGALYLSAATLGPSGPRFQILAWRGWNGTTFTSRRVLYTAPPGFQGFNGVAFGPDGRLYVGVDAGLLNGNDHGPASRTPYLYDVLSMNPAGGPVQVDASGIRQPWQLAFAPGSRTPFVSDLGQDGPKSVTNPPDFLLRVRRGDNYGFPRCNHTRGSRCAGFARPFRQFAPHTDIMGLAILGHTLYMGSYLGHGNGGALYSMPVRGGRVTTVVTGFPLATDALAAHDGFLYVGGSNQQGQGFVYRVKP